jgi:MSHA biogenesis protein MshI
MVWRNYWRVHMGWFLKSRRKPGWLAVNVLPEQVDVAHITRNGSQRPQVLMNDSFRKEGSDTHTLTRLRKEFELSNYRCTTLLKNGDYQMLQIEAPDVPDDEVQAATGWKVKDMIDSAGRNHRKTRQAVRKSRNFARGDRYSGTRAT